MNLVENARATLKRLSVGFYMALRLPTLGCYCPLYLRAGTVPAKLSAKCFKLTFSITDTSSPLSSDSMGPQLVSNGALRGTSSVDEQVVCCGPEPRQNLTDFLMLVVPWWVLWAFETGGWPRGDRDLLSRAK